MDKSNFQKSDIGAQAAWKGFSSQTYYIAARLILDEQGYEYYLEDIEDLVVKKDGIIVEAVQVKNISAGLTLSSLASTKTSTGGEVFFNRMCSIHTQSPLFNNIRIVYFGTLGTEFQEVEDNKEETKIRLSNRLKKSIYSQISSYVPAIAAPDLAQELLIQYISELSNTKGFTTLEIWRKKVHQVGIDVAALNGFYKVYPLILSIFVWDWILNEIIGFKKYMRLLKIPEFLVKGVSGQGKILCACYSD